MIILSRLPHPESKKRKRMGNRIQGNIPFIDLLLSTVCISSVTRWASNVVRFSFQV